MKKIVLFLLLPISGFSQNVSQDSSLQEVIVTATRQQTSIINLPYSVNKITASNVESFSFRTVPESLNGATGVFVQKTNQGGGSPFIRSLTGNQNLLLLDGIRMNNSTYRYGPNQYLNTIDVFSIANMEVVRGTGSVQYGSDAMGGVIQVFSKSSSFTEKPTWNISLLGKMVSSDMEYSSRGEFYYHSKNLTILVGITRRKFGDLLGGDTTGTQSPSGYKEQDYDIKALWKINNHSIFTIASQQVTQKDIPLYHRVKLENFKYYNFSPQKHNLNYARYELNTTTKLLDKIILTSSIQNSKEQRSYYKNAATSKFEELDKVKTIGLTAELISRIATNWSAISGIEWYHDYINSSKELISLPSEIHTNQRGLYPDNATSANMSAYSLHQIIKGSFQINAGVRYNSFAVKIKDTAAGYNQLGEVTIKPSSLVGNIALLYHLNSKQSIYASFNTGFRTPNVDDMGTLGLVDFRYEIPTYGLKPEKSYNTEIGYKIQTEHFKTSIALFYMQLTDLVTRVQVQGQQIGGYNVYKKENNQEAFVRGLEFDVQYRISKHFDLKSGISYAFGQNTTINEPMRRVPPLNGQVLLKYTANHWNVFIENLFAGMQNRLAQGDKDDNRIPVGGTPGWNIVNFYGGHQWKLIKLQLELGNLFNVDYRMHGSGINGIGRNFSCSLYYTL